MSYIRRCKNCGQRISMREMKQGQWVAFDVGSDTPHKHGKRGKRVNPAMMIDGSKLPESTMGRDLLIYAGLFIILPLLVMFLAN
jgi:hypothetical protein